MKKNTLLYLALILAIIGIIYSLTAFDRAFPIVNVRISADKHDILRKADSLTQRFAFMDSTFRSVAVFDTDERFKNFVELEGGGVEVFQEIVNTEIYHPYTWRVRQFNINEIRELEYAFSPSGDLLGFRLTLPDSLPGADIADPRSPQDLIARETQRDLLPDLSGYALIEQSSELKEGGRRDHLFTYERKDAGIGEGSYRMRIRVSGDELTLISPFVKIPDAFDLRYEEMRSANTTISLIGQAVMLVLYGILGVGVALFFMLRKKILLWKPALKWSVFIGVMVFLAQLTTISLAWFSYDTSLSSAQFMMQQTFMALLQGLLIALIFFISSMAGEGLDRQAFPGHIQFWRSWSPTIGASREIMRQTVFGYLWAFFMVGFITFFYWVTNHVFDWWSPAENMVDPNVLALPLPWLLPAANSLQAGFWEECLFRAVPLAGAVLIGKNFRKKGLWIALALIFQALIFGSMHANYAQQPAYARIIEMLIPFVLYGLIYIRWGLLPVVVSHFVYDIVLMAMPLFLLSSPGIWLHRIFAILAALIPLLVVIRRRIRAKAWYVLREHDFNAGYREAEPSGNAGPEKEIRIPATQSYRTFPLSVAVAALLGGCALWILLTPFEQDVARLDLDRRQALSIAGSFTEKQIGGFDTLGLSPYLRCESDIGNSERFVWEQSDQKTFRDLYRTVLSANHFIVSYKKFEGDIRDRSEQVDVVIGRDGDVLAWRHEIPEYRPGASLNEAEARTIAEAGLQTHLGVCIDSLETVRVSPEKRDARTDWTFILRDAKTGLKDGDIRYIATVSGDKLSGIRTQVHITESWERAQKKESILQTILYAVSKVIGVGFLISVLILGIVAWTKKQFNVTIFLLFLALFIFTSLTQGALMSQVIFGQFPTSEPRGNLILTLAISLVLGAVFSGFFYGIPAGYMARAPLQVQRNENLIALKGVGLGLLFAGVTAFARGDFYGYEPFAVRPADIDSLAPFLSSVLNGVEGYFIMLIRLLAPVVIADRLSRGWQEKRIPALILLLLSGFMFAGKLPLSGWLAGGAAAGVFMAALYILVLRYNMIYLPMMAATALILEMLQYLLVDPAVFTIAHVLVSAAVISALGIFSVWGVYRLRLLQPKNGT